MNRSFQTVATLAAILSLSLAAATSEEAWRSEVLSLVENLYSAQNASVANKDRGRTFHRKGRCAAVSVTVEKNIPEEFKVGFLKDGGTYPGYLRLSNGDGVSRSDLFDVRGAGLTIAGVKGKKLFEGGAWEKETQNFIGNNYPLFVANNDTIIPFFKAAIEAKKGQPGELLKFMATTPMTRRVVLTNVSMPPVGYLNHRYWSQAAFKIGAVNAKYSLIPCHQKAFWVALTPLKELITALGNSKSLTEIKDIKARIDNVLQTNLAEEAAADGRPEGTEVGCFHLAFQKQLDAEKMPTENPQVWWKEPGYFSPIPGVVIPDYLSLADLKEMFDRMKAHPFAMAEGADGSSVLELIQSWESRLEAVSLLNSPKTTIREALSHLPKVFTDIVSSHGPESPFVNVATVHVKKQDISRLDGFCENLEITPGHTSADIVPTGRISAIRPEVYEVMSAYRHADNGTKPFEPTGDVDKDLATYRRLNP